MGRLKKSTRHISLHHEDERDREAGQEEEREERLFLRDDLGEELPQPGDEVLLREEPLLLEVLRRDVEEHGARQPEERGGDRGSR